MSGLTGQPPQRVIFLLVQLTSVPVLSGNALADVCHRFQPGCRAQKNDFDQTTELSVEGIHLSSNAPTSKLSESACNRTVVFASFLTLLLLTQFLVCCIDRLNSRAIPVVEICDLPVPKQPLPPRDRRQLCGESFTEMATRTRPQADGNFIQSKVTIAFRKSRLKTFTVKPHFDAMEPSALNPCAETGNAPIFLRHVLNPDAHIGQRAPVASTSAALTFSMRARFPMKIRANSPSMFS